MPIATLTGKDTIIVAGRPLINFGDGDVATLEFPNDIFAVKVGKGGNAMFSQIANGRLAELKLRILRGSPDDVFLNALLKACIQDPPSFTLLTGLFIKRLGDGASNIQNDQYIASNGIFKKKVGVKENVEGETDQALAMYEITFADTNRAIM